MDELRNKVAEWSALDEEALARELAPVFVDVIQRYDVGFDFVTPLLLMFVKELSLSRSLSAVAFARHFARAVEICAAGSADGRAPDAARAVLEMVIEGR